MPWEECRGVSIVGDDLIPFVILNTQDTLTGRCFSLWHEYGHLVLGAGSACALGERSEENQVELWCNTFSAAFLMPADAVIEELERTPYLGLPADAWTIQLVRRFAKRFKVSPLAAARRLDAVAKVTLYRESAADLWLRERVKPPSLKGGGGELAEKRAVREYGVDVIEAVLDAVHRGIVDALEAGEAVGVAAARLSDLEAEVQKRA